LTALIFLVRFSSKPALKRSNSGEKMNRKKQRLKWSHCPNKYILAVVVQKSKPKNNNKLDDIMQ